LEFFFLVILVFSWGVWGSCWGFEQRVLQKPFLSFLVPVACRILGSTSYQFKFLAIAEEGEEEAEDSDV
jgi:hypothetical protein